MNSDVESLTEFIAEAGRLFILTGAGCSTDSGIPDYRDRTGQWKQKPPVHYPKFISRELVRKRYWARSLVGWQRVAQAKPNATHFALARLEAIGLVHQLVTQNVDRLHQSAGAKRVIDLHGRIDHVRCLVCSERSSRGKFQTRLSQYNGHWLGLSAPSAPDGDALLPEMDFNHFRVPSCEHCGGTLKPDVVFFGENVPEQRVAQAFGALEESDAFLVVGSSLMVFSGFRFVTRANEMGLPKAVLNQGRTRADGLWNLKIDARCSRVLPRVAANLEPR